MRAGPDRTEGLQAPDIDDQVRLIALGRSLVTRRMSPRAASVQSRSGSGVMPTRQVKPIGVPAHLKRDIPSVSPSV